MPIVLSVFLRYWREIAIGLLITAVYVYIYRQGEAGCEARVAITEEKAQQKIDALTVKHQKELQDKASQLNDQLKKDTDYSKMIEGKLDVERKKKVYVNTECDVPVDGVRLYNSSFRR